MKKRILEVAAGLIVALAVIGILHFAGVGFKTLTRSNLATAAARFPPGQLVGGVDSNNNSNTVYVDSSGNLRVITENPAPLPDAGNTQVPADLCTTVWHHGLVLCGNTPTLLPATPLVGRKSLLITNNGPTSIWFGGSTVGADDAGTNMGTTLLSTQSASLTYSGNAAFNVYCISEVAQATPTKGNPNGTSYNECY
jgi:hypothetical protein